MPDSIAQKPLIYWTLHRVQAGTNVTFTDETVVRTVLGTVQFLGDCSSSAAITAGDAWFTLPDECRPANDVFLPVVFETSSNAFSVCMMRVDSATGECSMTQNSNGTVHIRGLEFSVIDKSYGGISWQQQTT